MAKIETCVIPDEIKKLITRELLEAFTLEIEAAHGKYVHEYPNDEMWWSNTFGWSASFEKACRKTNSHAVFGFYESLPVWSDCDEYESDTFTGDIYDMVVAEGLTLSYEARMLLPYNPIWDKEIEDRRNAGEEERKKREEMERPIPHPDRIMEEIFYKTEHDCFVILQLKPNPKFDEMRGKSFSAIYDMGEFVVRGKYRIVYFGIPEPKEDLVTVYNRFSKYISTTFPKGYIGGIVSLGNIFSFKLNGKVTSHIVDEQEGYVGLRRLNYFFGHIDADDDTKQNMPFEIVGESEE